MLKRVSTGVVVIAAVVAAVFVFRSGKLSNGTPAPPATATPIIELKHGDSYDLVAAPVEKQIGDRRYRMLAYNGSIPGPLIKVAQGAEVTINLRNDIDVDTALHSHGLRLDNRFDGAPPHTQAPIRPGESFSYKIKFPDAGMYWYHPHVREDYAQELGLYGNYLVVPNEPGYWNPVHREIALFLDDILIEDGRIPLNKDHTDHVLMGRFGNVMLVNGEPDYRLEVKRGELVRFYLTNAANTRTFNFAIAGAKLKLVGGDGGAAERESWADAVMLSPSERVVVEALFSKAGSYALENRTPRTSEKLGTVVAVTESAAPSRASAFSRLRRNAAAIKSIDPYRSRFDKPVDKRLSLTIEMKGGTGGGHRMPDGSVMSGSMAAPSSDGIEWEDMDAESNKLSSKETAQWKIVDPDSGKANMNIDWRFKVGDQVRIRITNDAASMHPMQHPLHFHGQRFLVLDRNGVKNDNMVWKDTVLVPAGQYVDILLDVSNPGEWMAHCHIAEHLEAGMMFSFKVS